MKKINKIKKLIGMVAVLGVLGAGGVVFASEILRPADIAANLTGKSVTEVNQERAAGKTYGTMANEAGKLDEFKTQMIEQKKVILDQRVEEGRMTEEQADEIYNRIKDNQALCDGTGSGKAQIGKGCGVGFGNGNGGNGNGKGLGQGRENGVDKGQGMGRGQGQGQRGAGLGNGSI